MPRIRDTLSASRRKRRSTNRRRSRQRRKNLQTVRR